MKKISKWLLLFIVLLNTLWLTACVVSHNTITLRVDVVDLYSIDEMDGLKKDK